MKKLAVLGATGGTGQQVVVQALEAGHAVTALVRTPDKLNARHDRLHVVVGDVKKDSAQLAEVIRGHDVVISALGRGASLKSDSVIEHGVRAVLDAMNSTGVRRLIFISAIGVGAAYPEVPLFSRLMIRVLLKDLYADKVIGENLIRASGFEWTMIQPSALTNGPLTGRYRAAEHVDYRMIPTISRADVAHFIVRQVDDRQYLRKTVQLTS